jgi:hypothetical protein
VVPGLVDKKKAGACRAYRCAGPHETHMEEYLFIRFHQLSLSLSGCLVVGKPICRTS